MNQKELDAEQLEKSLGVKSKHIGASCGVIISKHFKEEAESKIIHKNSKPTTPRPTSALKK